eukprot:TRINITY_DN47192_c0_g1_i1.p1 TRINITY_DN47192_c0_g1~~TRINITY_DN47192_c0_g1_i1.p1  ORF type:complete len:304 (+),score=16.63 TRINITY_DN47192_c0_g1_i1:31-912(+)
MSASGKSPRARSYDDREDGRDRDRRRRRDQRRGDRDRGHRNRSNDRKLDRDHHRRRRRSRSPPPPTPDVLPIAGQPATCSGPTPLLLAEALAEAGQPATPAFQPAPGVAVPKSPDWQPVHGVAVPNFPAGQPRSPTFQPATPAGAVPQTPAEQPRTPACLPMRQSSSMPVSPRFFQPPTPATTAARNVPAPSTPGFNLTDPIPYEVIQRLSPQYRELMRLSSDELRAECSRRKLATNGDEDALISRILKSRARVESRPGNWSSKPSVVLVRIRCREKKGAQYSVKPKFEWSAN